MKRSFINMSIGTSEECRIKILIRELERLKINDVESMKWIKRRIDELNRQLKE